MPLDRLQNGNQVRIVYNHAGQGRREVVEITRVEQAAHSRRLLRRREFFPAA